MSDHRERLGPVLADDEPLLMGASPAGDPAIRAELRLLAEALHAVAAPPLGDDLAGLADDLPEWFSERRDLYEHHMALAAGAMALEEHLQHGTLPGADPSLDAGLDRRLRLWAWIRLFLMAVEEHLGPSADGLSEAALAWMHERQRRLAMVILALDRRARRAAAEAAPTDTATLDEIGQAVVVQAHLRLLVEALGASLR
jgi:hypothetical protein